MRIRFLVMALLTGGVCTSAIAQTDFSQVEITTTEVAPSIYMLEGAGGNIGVSAGEDGVFLIDDQYAPLTPKIVAAVKAAGFLYVTLDLAGFRSGSMNEAIKTTTEDTP